MEFLWAVLAVLLFAAACNLDTVILAMGYAAKGIQISPARRLVIAAVTTLVTWLSLALGDAAALVLSEALAAMLGGLVLVGIGLWFVLDWLRRPGDGNGQTEGNRVSNLWGCVSLAAALAVNNAGVCVAAGVSGISPGWAALGNFGVTLVCLTLGRRLGNRLTGRMLGKCALPLSGALLIVLGAWEAFAGI